MGGLALVSSVAGGASSTALVALINHGLNKGIGETAGQFVLLCILAFCSTYLSRILLIRLGQKTALDLRLDLSKQLLSVPFRFIEEKGKPALLATLTDDIQSIASSVPFLPNLIMNLVVAGGCLAYLAWLSWELFLLVLGATIVGMGTFRILQKKARRFFELGRESIDTLFSDFKSLTDGFKELKLHLKRQQAFLSDVLQPTAVQLYTNQTKRF